VLKRYLTIYERFCLKEREKKKKKADRGSGLINTIGTPIKGFIILLSKFPISYHPNPTIFRWG